jgi:CheY-like chemotaxis protein
MGSNFSFTIPFEQSEAPKQVEKLNLNNNHIKTDLRIIAADDNKVNQDIIRLLLSKKNLKADYADNGKILLQMLAMKEYDLILMDMQMPEMDGLDATASIRRNEQTQGKHIIIIALTANAMKGDREICINSGMDDYLSKPLRYTELSDMIDKYFST